MDTVDLLPQDVPGGNLKKSLLRWLAARGLKKTGVKPELVAFRAVPVHFFFRFRFSGFSRPKTGFPVPIPAFSGFIF